LQRFLERAADFIGSGQYLNPYCLSQKYLDGLRKRPFETRNKGIMLVGTELRINDDKEFRKPEAFDIQFDAWDFQKGCEEYVRIMRASDDAAVQARADDREAFFASALGKTKYPMARRINYVVKVMEEYSAVESWVSASAQDVALLLSELVKPVTSAGTWTPRWTTRSS